MMTRRAAKAVGVEPPPVHGAEKAIDHPQETGASARPSESPISWPIGPSTPHKN